MIHLIAPEFHADFEDQLTSMYRLRCRVFRERLGWAVNIRNGLESDHFDTEGPVYLLCVGPYGEVQGCVRLLPTTGPNMLRDCFACLAGDLSIPCATAIWESSRFAIEPGDAEIRRGLARGTFELFAAMIEFGLSRDLQAIVTVTDLRIERILKRAGWDFERLGPPQSIDDTTAVAGLLDISPHALLAVRRAGGIEKPVLWAPVLPAPVCKLSDASRSCAADSDCGARQVPATARGA